MGDTMSKDFNLMWLVTFTDVGDSYTVSASNDKEAILLAMSEGGYPRKPINVSVTTKGNGTLLAWDVIYSTRHFIVEALSSNEMQLEIDREYREHKDRPVAINFLGPADSVR